MTTRNKNITFFFTAIALALSLSLNVRLLKFSIEDDVIRVQYDTIIQHKEVIIDSFYRPVVSVTPLGNVYSNTIKQDGITLNYRHLIHHGELLDSKYSIISPESRIYNTSTILNTKYRLYGTVGSQFYGPTLTNLYGGFNIASPNVLLGYHYDPFNRLHGLQFGYKILAR